MFSHGARFGGHSLFIKDQKLWYVNNFLGIPPEQQLTSPDALGAGLARARHAVRRRSRWATARRRSAPSRSTWTTRPSPRPRGARRPGHFALCGEGLAVGRDSADPVSKEYGPGFDFTGGTIQLGRVVAGDDQYLDLESQAMAMLARE